MVYVHAVSRGNVRSRHGGLLMSMKHDQSIEEREAASGDACHLPVLADNAERMYELDGGI